MDELTSWSERIAEAVAPDEIDLAGMMARAYVRGGKDRAELFRQSRGVAGAFSTAELIAVVPLVLEAINQAHLALEQLLSLPEAEVALTAFKTALMALEVRHAARQLENLSRTEAALEPLRDGAAYVPARQAQETLQAVLEQHGRTSDEAEKIADEVLRLLLEEPRSAAMFVRRVAGQHRETPAG